jgi:hypothetical protein
MDRYRIVMTNKRGCLGGGLRYWCNQSATISSSVMVDCAAAMSRPVSRIRDDEVDAMDVEQVTLTCKT